MSKTTEYRASDLNLTAFLRAKHNLKIDRLEPDPEERDRALFVFIINDDLDIDKIVTEYFNGADSCSINRYNKELADLRSWIRSFRINRNN